VLESSQQSHAAASFDEASSICEDTQFRQPLPGHHPGRPRSSACNNGRYYSRFKGRSREVHKRIWLEPVPASGRGGRRALVELQVRIAPNKVTDCTYLVPTVDASE